MEAYAIIFKLIHFFFNREALDDEFKLLTNNVEQLHRLLDSDLPWLYDGWGIYPDEKKFHQLKFELDLLIKVFHNDYLIWKLNQ